MPRAPFPRHQPGRLPALAVIAGVITLAVWAYAARGFIAERYLWNRLEYGSEDQAFRAAAELSGRGRESLERVQAWAAREALEAALVAPAPGNPSQAVMRDDTLLLLAGVLAREGDLPAAEAAAGALGSDAGRAAAGDFARRQASQRGAAPVDPLAEARALVRDGDLLGALRAVGAAEEWSRRFDHLDGLLGMLQDTGARVDSLRSLAEAIDPEASEGWALHPLAVLLARGEDLSGAAVTALRAPRLRSYRHEGLPHVLEALARAGQAENALRLAGRYEGGDRAHAVARIARALASGGHREAARAQVHHALELTRGLPDRESPYVEDLKSGPLEQIALAQWQLGDVAASRESFRRAAILASGKNEHLVTETQADAGDLEGATLTAHALRAEKGVHPGFEHIARAQARSGDFANALATAEGLRDPWLLAFIGAEQRRRGNAPAAGATFRRALAVAGAIPAGVGGSPSRASAYFGIARHEASSGEARESLDQARRETAGLWRANLLLGLAEGLAERAERTDAPPAGDCRTH